MYVGKKQDAIPNLCNFIFQPLWNKKNILFCKSHYFVKSSMHVLLNYIAKLINAISYIFNHILPGYAELNMLKTLLLLSLSLIIYSLKIVFIFNKFQKPCALYNEIYFNKK